MVGVPESSFSFWASKFLAKGYKVGKVEQVETALGAEMRVAASKGKGTKTSEKGLVRRVLNKVFTNGTLVDGDFLVDEEAGHCISIRVCNSGTMRKSKFINLVQEQGENAFGLAILDSSTSEFNLSAFIDDVCRTKLETILRQLRPKELVYSKVSQYLRPKHRPELIQITGKPLKCHKPPAQDSPSRKMYLDMPPDRRGLRLRGDSERIEEALSAKRGR